VGAAIRLEVDDGPSPVRHDVWWNAFAAVWPRKDVSWRAKKILGALVVLAEGRTGHVSATMGDIAAKAGVCEKTASRGVQELNVVQVIDWCSLASGFKLLIQINSDSQSPQTARTLLSFEETKPSPRDGFVPDFLPPPYNPPLRQNSNTAAAGTVLSEREGALPPDVISLIHDAMRLSKSVSAGQVLVALEQHSLEDIRAGVNEAAKVAKTGGVRRSVWGLVLSVARTRGHERSVLADARRLGLEFPELSPPAVPVVSAAPVPPPPGPVSEEEIAGQVAQALAGGFEGKLAAVAIRVGVREGVIPRELVPAELLGEQSAQKEPAAGSVAKPSPQPVGGPSPDATPDYSPKINSCEIECSSPEIGPCARRDSNSQPSDSKSAWSTRGITDTLAGAVSLGRCLPRFDVPESDPKPPRRRKRRGLDIRDSMRC
jgi:hypothetical protein